METETDDMVFKESAYQYVLETVSKDLWAPPYRERCTWGHSTSNMVESMNALLRQDRTYNIVDLLDAIWNRVMAKRYELLEDARKKHTAAGRGGPPGRRTISAYAAVRLAESINHSQARLVQVSMSLLRQEVQV